MLVDRAELEAVKHIVGMENKRKKVRKIISPEEGSEDIKRVARKHKNVIIKMSKKKKQQTTMELDNPYLLMRARNTIRNEDNLKEIEMKEKETKLTMYSSVKIQASPG